MVKIQRKFLWVRLGCQASQRRGLTSGKVRGTSGQIWETSVEPLDCCWVPQRENFRGSRRKFGELQGKSGNFPEARGSLTPSQRLIKIVSKRWSFWAGYFWDIRGPDVRDFPDPAALRCPGEKTSCKAPFLLFSTGNGRDVPRFGSGRPRTREILCKKT